MLSLCLNIQSSNVIFISFPFIGTRRTYSNLKVGPYEYEMFLKNDYNYEKVIAGVIPLRTFKNDFIPASIKINKREKDALEIKPITLNNFEKELFNLILEIFDPSVPIVEKKI